MQSTFNFEENVYNMDKDWYWISQKTVLTWQEYYDSIISQKRNLLVQIPAMGWVGKLNSSNNPSWSYSQINF